MMICKVAGVIELLQKKYNHPNHEFYGLFYNGKLMIESSTLMSYDIKANVRCVDNHKDAWIDGCFIGIRTRLYIRSTWRG